MSLHETGSQVIDTYNLDEAPEPLGSYSHAVGFQDLLFLCGMGPRDPETNDVPGLVLDPEGKKYRYDIEAETRATLENMKLILEAAGSSLSHVLDVSVFLTDMDDFPQMNKIYREYFKNHKPVRTTLGVVSLPGAISVEMKAIAVRTKAV